MERINSFDDLKKYRDNLNKKVRKDKKIKIVVHMGTCCIAAGSREVLEAMKAEVVHLSLEKKVDVVPGGCIGLCYAEPTVAICHPDGRHEIYGTVDIQQGRIIVNRCQKQSPVMGLNQIKPNWEPVSV
jgi:(2Fe-2S) ferredoxin